MVMCVNIIFSYQIEVRGMEMIGMIRGNLHPRAGIFLLVQAWFKHGHGHQVDHFKPHAAPCTSSCAVMCRSSVRTVHFERTRRGPDQWSTGGSGVWHPHAVLPPKFFLC